MEIQLLLLATTKIEQREKLALRCIQTTADQIHPETRPLNNFRSNAFILRQKTSKFHASHRILSDSLDVKS